MALGDFRRRSGSESSNLVTGSICFSPSSSSSASSSPSATLRKKSKAKTLHRNHVSEEHIVVDNSNNSTNAINNSNNVVNNNYNNSNSNGNDSNNNTIPQRCRGFSQPPVVGSRLANYISTITPCSSVDYTTNNGGNGYFVVKQEDQYIGTDTNVVNDAVMSIIPTNSNKTPPTSLSSSSSQSTANATTTSTAMATSSTPSNNTSSSNAPGQTQRWIAGINNANVMQTGVVIGDNINNNKYVASPSMQTENSVTRPTVSTGSATNAGGNNNNNGSGGSGGGGGDQRSGTWVMGTSMGGGNDMSFTYLPPLRYGSFTLPATASAFSQALSALENGRNLLDQLKAYDTPNDFVVECTNNLSSHWNTILER